MPRTSRYAVAWWPRMAAQVTGTAGGLVILHEGGRTFMASEALADWQAGMPLAHARRLYGHATFVERNHACESAAAAILIQRLSACTPRVMALRPGYFLLQKPDLARLAHIVRQHGRLRGGAASCSEWAELAVHQVPPGVLCRVANPAAFLEAMPVSALADLLGGEGMEATGRLQLFGLRTLAMVARRLTKRHLQAQFGHDLGQQLERFLRPGRQPAVPVYTAPREVGVTHELEMPTCVAAAWIRPVLARLASRLAVGLKGMAALTLALQAFIPGQGMVSHRYVSRRGLSSDSDLRRLAMQLFEKLCATLSSAEVLSVHLVAGHLTAAAWVQRQLYTPRTEAPELRRAVSLIQKRYGSHAMLQAQRKESLFAEQRLTLVPFQRADVFGASPRA